MSAARKWGAESDFALPLKRMGPTFVGVLVSRSLSCGLGGHEASQKRKFRWVLVLDVLSRKIKKTL